MFVVKISKDKQLLGICHYNVFQNALADILNGNVFESTIDEAILDGIDSSGAWGIPKISSHSVSDAGIADDFEFKYDNGVLVYLGEIFVVDEKH